MNRDLTTSRFTMLIVADSFERRDAVAASLGRDGTRVLTAADPGDALSVFIRERPQLLVIERCLLESTGAELLARARALEPAVAAIAVGSFVGGRARLEAIEELELDGVHDMRDDPERLVELVASVLSRRKAYERSRTTEELRELIVAKVCHDLRTALHVIRGYSEILRSESFPPAGDDVLGRLASAADTALDLMQNYLDLARLESPAVAVRRERLSIDGLVEELRAAAAREIGDRPLRFTALVPRAATDLHTDGEKLRVILLQLLANAIKFSMSGDVCLSLRLAPRHADFVLSNSGPGLAATDLEALSRPFCQLRESLLSSTPGQGIGLAIAVRLSTLIGASLAVESGRSSGAVFTLRVPIGVPTEESEHDRPMMH